MFRSTANKAQRKVWQALGLGLVVTLVVLALSACAEGGGGGGGGEEQAKARPLPEQPQELRPGEYRSEEFKPSVSFRVGEGWLTNAQETSDYLQMGWAEKAGGPEKGGMAFTNVQKVYEPIYKPTETSTPKLVEAPEDLVGWFQHHPYLKTSKPEPATVGGVKGVQIDVLVEELPKDFLGRCGVQCVDIAPLSGGEQSVFYKEANKRRVIVLEDVKGETVTIDFSTPVVLFDKFAPQAQKVVGTVKWGGS